MKIDDLKQKIPWNGLEMAVGVWMIADHINAKTWYGLSSLLVGSFLVIIVVSKIEN